MLGTRPTGRLILAFLLLVTALNAAAVLAAPKPWTVSAEKVGPLRFGMSSAEAYKALGVAQDAQLVVTSGGDSCVEVPIPEQTDTMMMFENNRLSRIFFYGESPLKTSLGIGIGATESEVMAKYPLAEATPRARNDPPAKDLTLWGKKNVAGLRFQTNDKREVDTILVGGQSITYADGCA